MAMVTEGERLTLSIPEAAKVLGISRGLAYSLARRDALPVPVIKLGRRLVLSRRAVEALLDGGNEAVRHDRQ